MCRYESLQRQISESYLNQNARREKTPKWELLMQEGLRFMHLPVPSALAMAEAQKRGSERLRAWSGRDHNGAPADWGEGSCAQYSPLPKRRKPRNSGRCRNHECAH